jgi:hypothetical protein
VRDNNKVGVFAYAKDFSTTLRSARNDGKSGLDLHKKTPQSVLCTDSSPLGGGAEIAVEMTEGKKSSVNFVDSPFVKGAWCGASHLDSSAMLLPARGKGVGYASRRMTRWGRALKLWLYEKYYRLC